MARTVTLSNLRERALKRADMQNSRFLSDSEWNQLINDSASELYDLLVGVFSDYYITTATVTTDGTNDSYSLPADFYKLRGVDEVISGQGVTVDPYAFEERNKYQKLTGSGRQVTLHYIPALSPMVADADTFDGINGWDEYIVIDAAKKAKGQEESDTSQEEKDKAAMASRIQALAPSRDAGSPARIIDIYARENEFDIPQVSTLRYRIVGSNIQFVEASRGGAWR